MTQLIGLGLFGGLSLNILLQFGMGLKTLVAMQHFGLGIALLPSLSIFASGMLTWVFLANLLAPFSLGFIEPLILYPAVETIGLALRKSVNTLRPTLGLTEMSQDPYAHGGSSLVSAMLTLRLATRFLEALALSLGMSLGFFIALLLLKEIQKRSSGESVPPFLRGTPLILISAGFVSLLAFAVSTVLIPTFGLD